MVGTEATGSGFPSVRADRRAEWARFVGAAARLARRAARPEPDAFRSVRASSPTGPARPGAVRSGSRPGPPGRGFAPTSRRAGAGPVRFAILSALPLLLGCGLLDTRTPESPEGENVPFLNPTEPSIVLTNVEVTLEAKRTINYASSIEEDEFLYAPAPGDEQDFTTPWGRTEELSAADAIVATDASIVVTWTIPGDLLQGENDNEVYYRDLGYRLDFTSGGVTITYSGLCDMYFRETSSLYRIFRWDDKEDGSGNRTWTRLRITRGPVFSSGAAPRADDVD